MMIESWGKDLTILVASDFNYLPGVYGLFNSAIENGFTGKFRIVKIENFDSELICKHPQIEIDILEKRKEVYHNNVQRLNYLKKLVNGKFLFLDADIIIERPIHFLIELLDKSILVSKEPEPKYNSEDILYQRQAFKAGYNPFNSREIGYINGGLIGFNLPVHKLFIEELVSKSFNFLQGIKKYTENPDWFFIDQDMLNVVLRNIQIPVSVISPRLLELGGVSLNKAFYKRPFPFQRQIELFPKDQLKYIIHGASLRRPWLSTKANNLTNSIKNKLIQTGVRGLLKKPTAYERAWAYYACREDLPIPISSWTKQHHFSAYKNALWRRAHGI